MAATAALTNTGFGVTLAKKLANNGYDVIAELVSIDMPEASRGSVDFTHFASPDGYKEFKPSRLRDAGEIKFSFALIPGGPDEGKVRSAFQSDTVDSWRVSFVNGCTFDWQMFATSVGNTVPIDDRMVGSATFKITGRPVVTLAA